MVNFQNLNEYLLNNYKNEILEKKLKKNYHEEIFLHRKWILPEVW